jgi:hypothetical protein
MRRSTHVFGKARVVFSTFLVLGLLAPSITQAKRELRGTVYLLGPQDELEPVPNTPVRIEGRGDSDVTTSTGTFRIHLPEIFKPGDTVILRVDMKDYQVLYPYGGQVRIPAAPLKDPVHIQLDKKGSHRFMTHEAFALLIEKIANEAKKQVRTDAEPQEVDLGRYLKDWAVKYGFGLDQVRVELDKWAAEIEATSDDFHKLGLAAFYKENFGEAAKNFTQSAQEHERQLAKVRKQEAELTKKVIRDYNLAGDAYSHDYRFQDAIQSYRKALHIASREALPEAWAMTQTNLGDALATLGEYDHDAELLKKAKTAIQAVYAFYMDSGDTQYADYFERKLSSIDLLIEELK